MFTWCKLGPGLPGAWGPGLGAGASRGLGPGLSEPWANFSQCFVVLKSPLAKGWETAETAAAEVGREAGTGYPPYPTPPPRF